MKILKNLLQKTKTYQCFENVLKLKAKETQIYGMGEETRRFFWALCADTEKTLIIVLENIEKASLWLKELSLLSNGLPVLLLPPEDLFGLQAISARGMELKEKRLLVERKINDSQGKIILTTAEAILQKVIPLVQKKLQIIELKTAQECIMTDLIAKLVAFGYERTEEVDNVGLFSVRGGIIDIFPIQEKYPLRIEFFDNEIDSIRSFDIVTQRTVSNVNGFEIFALSDLEVNDKQAEEKGFIFEGLRKQLTVVLDDPARIQEEATRLLKENTKEKATFFSWGVCLTKLKEHNLVYFSSLLKQIPFAQPKEVIGLTIQELAVFYREQKNLTEDIFSWQRRGFKIYCLLSSEEKINYWQEKLVYQEKLKIEFLQCNCVRGFELLQEKLVFISERELYGKKNILAVQSKTSDAWQKNKKSNLDLRVGDYVVHVNYGIGRYMGVETMEVEGVHKDYFYLKYFGEDKLYVPTESVELLQKYSVGDGVVPRLNKLSSREWQKTKQKTAKAIKDIAFKLLTLQAKRKMVQGIAFDQDTDWQKEFEKMFPYNETEDQLKAIKDVKKDMEETSPMDRLICGDVGFGKTEVAMRAAFKAVMSGKQAIILAPTTILVQQHYQNFTARCQPFGIRVAMLSRFIRPLEQKKIIKAAKNGEVDILIGTHRLLQKDILLNNLGLLVIDEEQRFGVEQKEKIKEMCTNIDILTLSATPIPRTLHMALTHSKDFSIIETPPEERLPVQAYVAEEDEELIKAAIQRELDRGGQVFVVYNRVKDIDKLRDKLKALMPEVTFITGHGQMDEQLLEKVMLDFYEQNFDVLLCTTIIENGLDMPNVNTIIVYDADKMGLSQLYQIKGRVGRANRLAYAYFLYKKNKVLSEVAEKRLHALQNFTSLGAGLRIAKRDMEIRGAGNILGAEQHGYIVNVGFDLYCKMLEKAVSELQSTGESHLVDTEIEFQIVVDAYLPSDYISEPMHKIDIYKKIALIKTENDIVELLDELIDRFGDLPLETLNLIEVARCKNMMRELGLIRVSERNGRLEFFFGEHPNVLPEKALALGMKIKMPVKLAQKEAKIVVRLLDTSCDKMALVKKVLENLLPFEQLAHKV